jgi:hypothetical protein
MSDPSLVAKLKLRGGQRAALINAPDSYGKDLGKIPPGVNFSSVQTDLTRDAGWDALRSHELKWVTLVSINQTWSAFAMRRYRPGEEASLV